MSIRTCDVCGSIHHTQDSEDPEVIICPDCIVWAASMGAE